MWGPQGPTHPQPSWDDRRIRADTIIKRRVALAATHAPLPQNAVGHDPLCAQSGPSRIEAGVTCDLTATWTHFTREGGG